MYRLPTYVGDLMFILLLSSYFLCLWCSLDIIIPKGIAYKPYFMAHIWRTICEKHTARSRTHCPHFRSKHPLQFTVLVLATAALWGRNSLSIFALLSFLTSDFFPTIWHWMPALFYCSFWLLKSLMLSTSILRYCNSQPKLFAPLTVTTALYTATIH